MPTPQSLVNILADGRFHSGEELGAILRVSRGAVWKSLKGLERFGLVVQAVPGKGYRLNRPLELLERERLVANLDERSRELLAELEVHFELGSTNTYLMERAVDGGRSGLVCVSELQTNGRGRRGRSWASPFARNVYLSVLWRFSHGALGLGGLSLAIGVAVLRGLRRAAVDGVQLKWPNDLLWNMKKLGGVLVEVAGESNGPCQVVAGVGLNIDMGGLPIVPIDQPWVDVGSIVQGVSRNQLGGAVLHELLLTLSKFEKEGLSPFLKEWRDADCLCGKRVTLELPNGAVIGDCQGIDSDGSLLLDVDGKLERYSFGEVSLRALG